MLAPWHRAPRTPDLAFAGRYGPAASVRCTFTWSNPCLGPDLNFLVGPSLVNRPIVGAMSCTMSDVPLLHETRGRLKRDLRLVQPAAAEWTPVPGARTIAESLLHIAAVEFVFATALALRRSVEVPFELWDHLKAGLATEVGYDPPKRVSVADCIERLERVRNLTLTVIDDDALVTEIELRSALQSLHDAGADLPCERLDALVPKLSSHLGAGTLGIMLTAHEEYHRGQILYQNYLATRLTRAE